MNDPIKKYRIAVIILSVIIVVLILVSFGVIKINFTKTAQDQTFSDQDAQLQETIAKTIYGQIEEISSDSVKVKLITAENNGEEKTIKINASTKFQKYEPIENAQGSYQGIDAQVSDFKKDDYVNVLVDKKITESDLTAVNIDLVTLPKPENVTS